LEIWLPHCGRKITFCGKRGKIFKKKEEQKKMKKFSKKKKRRAKKK
jgi:hypothetical protein